MSCTIFSLRGYSTKVKGMIIFLYLFCGQEPQNTVKWFTNLKMCITSAHQRKKADWEISKLFYHIRLNLNFHNTLLWKLSFSTLPASTDLEEHWTHFSSIFSLSVDTSRTAFPKCLLCFLFAVQTKQRKSPLNWRNGYFGPTHHLTCPLFPLQLAELLHWSFSFF